MIVNLSLKDNKLNILFQESVKSLIKIQLITVYGFKNSDSSMLIFEKEFSLNNTIDVKEYLEEQNYTVLSTENLTVSLTEHYQKKKNLSDKIKELKKITTDFNENEFKKYLQSLTSLKRPLLPHQQKPSFHLYKAKSAANFSVPGSGKTSVVLSYYQKLKEENKVDCIFVIGPKVCFNSWNDEFVDTLGRSPNIKMLSDSAKKRKDFYLSKLSSELVTCHFSLASNDTSDLISFFNSYRFLLVVDEAHNIKKISGTWASSILTLGKYCEYKVILTGTPMPNEFRDFFNYLDFLYGDNQILTSYDKAQIEVYIKNKKNDEAIELLREKIDPFFTRVTKKDLNLSKPNFNKPLFVKMNPIEQKIYDAIVSRIKNFNDESYIQNIEFVQKMRKAKIIRLMQSCSYIKNFNISLSDTDLIEGTDFSDIEGNEDIVDNDLEGLIIKYDSLEKPAKLSQLKLMVKNLSNQNRKVLIWSNHLKTIDLIKNSLLKDGHFVKVIIGFTTDDERKNIKKEFNEKSSLLNVIVANPKACSESISLHKACHNAIYYDQNYNTAEFLQSLDRIHRVGGSEHTPVFYDFLQYENTIEQKIYKKIREKADRQMKVIESDNLIFSPDEADDWNDLYEEIIK